MCKIIKDTCFKFIPIKSHRKHSFQKLYSLITQHWKVEKRYRHPILREKGEGTGKVVHILPLFPSVKAKQQEQSHHTS